MALSQGISEALINTAFGILTGALAVISYNYYTNNIDKLTYGLDEVGFSIVQTFAATHKYGEPFKIYKSWVERKLKRKIRS